MYWRRGENRGVFAFAWEERVASDDVIALIAPPASSSTDPLDKMESGVDPTLSREKSANLASKIL